MNDTIATRVKYFDFDNDTSEKIFPHSYISYMANKILQVEKVLHSSFVFSLYLFEMPCFNAKIILEIAPKKQVYNGKTYIKMLYQIAAANALACSRIVTHSNAALCFD